MTDPETQLASFFARFDAATARLGTEVRERLRARLPGLHEVVYVYEGQGSLVISYSASGRGYDGLCSLSVTAERVCLYFSQGAALSDPDKLLQGKARLVRFVPLDAAADLDRPEIEALFIAALALAKLRLDPSATRSVIIKAEEQKKRADRARKTGA